MTTISYLKRLSTLLLGMFVSLAPLMANANGQKSAPRTEAEVLAALGSLEDAMSTMVQLSKTLEAARLQPGGFCDSLKIYLDRQVSADALVAAAALVQEELGINANPMVELAKSLRQSPAENGALHVSKTACATDQLGPMAQLIQAEFRALSTRIDSVQVTLAAELEAPALVVSGGVSMGSYQAGFAEGLLRQLRSMDSARPIIQNRYPNLFTRLGDRAHLKTNVGASAGSINAFIAGIESCTSSRDANLDKSLFFKTWIDVGFDTFVEKHLGTEECPGTKHRLYESSSVEGDHILNDCAIKAVATRLGEEITARAAQLNGCSFDLAMTATRLSPRSIPLATGVSAELPRMTEKFLMRVDFDGTGAHYRAFEPPSSDAQRFFPKVKDDFQQISEILRASGAFPLAFSPPDLEKAYDPLPGIRAVKTETSETSDRYIDGGLFNNNPLDMARLLQKTQAARFGQEDIGKYLFLDQDFTEAMRPLPQRRYKGGSFYVNYQEFLPRLFEVATTQQLMAQLEYEPELLRHLLVPIRTRASASEFVFAMSGFLHRDLRVIDFYDGVLDAERMAEKFPLKHLAQLHAIPLAPVTAPSPGLQCVRALRAMGVAWPSTKSVKLPDVCLGYLKSHPEGTEKESSANIVTASIALSFLEQQRRDYCGTMESKGLQNAMNSDCEKAHGFNALRESYEEASRLTIQNEAQAAFDARSLDFNDLAAQFREHSGRAVHTFARRHGGLTLPLSYRIALGEFLDGAIQYRPRSRFLLRAHRMDGGSALSLGAGYQRRWAPIRSSEVNFDLGYRVALDLGMSWETRAGQQVRAPDAFLIRPELGGSVSLGRNSLARVEGRLGVLFPTHLSSPEGMAWLEATWSPALAFLFGDFVELEFAWRMPTGFNVGSRRTLSLFSENLNYRFESGLGIRW